MPIDLSKTHQLSKDGQYWELKPGYSEVYNASLKAQLEAWVNGVDKHTENLPDGMASECTPDFACCKPHLAWPLDVRKKFASASREEQEAMLFGSLSSLLIAAAEEDPKIPKVYLTDGEQNQLIGDDRKVKYKLH